MQKKRHPILTALCIPFSLIYGVIIFIRNQCFNTGLFPSREFNLPVITVGNITVGGTGKTPHVEYVVSLLNDNFKLAVLSRGYMRKSSGFVVASTASTAEEVGDEPLQIKKKYPSVEVAVDAKRVRGMKNLISYNPELEAVILDDAFQHRWIKPGISILLVDYNQPLKNDLLLPAGRLREPVSAKNRAAIVVITKCPPDIKPIERRILSRDLNLFPWQSLFFTTFSYGEPLPVFPDAKSSGAIESFEDNKPFVLMITGIASPDLFAGYLEGISSGIESVSFPDHHNFTKRDMERILKVWKSINHKYKVMITTEKDAMRLQFLSETEPEIKRNIYYIPIRVRFVKKDGEEFNKQIINYVRNNKRNHIISQK